MGQALLRLPRFALQRGNHIKGMRVEAPLVPALEGAQRVAVVQLVLAQRFLLNKVRRRLRIAVRGARGAAEG